MPTVTLFLINAVNTLSFVNGGPGRLFVAQRTIRKVSPWGYKEKTTHMRRPSQENGNDRTGETITPTLASASSGASRWASAPPIIVNFIGTFDCASTSALRATKEAIISAFLACTTNVSVPCRGIRAVSTLERPRCEMRQYSHYTHPGISSLSASRRG